MSATVWTMSVSDRVRNIYGSMASFIAPLRQRRAVQPERKTTVIRACESLLEIVRHMIRAVTVLAQDDRTTVAERNRADLAHDLAADVVAVWQIDEDLD